MILEAAITPTIISEKTHFDISALWVSITQDFDIEIPVQMTLIHLRSMESYDVW